MRTKIKNIIKHNARTLVELEHSHLRPAGGGQPEDHAILKNAGTHIEIACVEEDGKLMHVIKSATGDLSPGDEVEIILNENRRNKLSRMHTAEHIFFKAIQKQIPGMSVDKIRLDEDTSHIYVRAEKMGWGILISAETLANGIVSECRPIKVKEVPKSEAEAIEDLRIKTERIRSDTVRVIEIEDFDMSACTGTHCQNTSEVGSIFVTAFRAAGKNLWEVDFTVGTEECYRYASIARKAITLLGSDAETFFNSLVNLREEHARYKEIAKIASENEAESAAEKIEPEDVDGRKMYFHEFEDSEKHQMVSFADKIRQRDEQAVIVMVNRAKNQLLVVAAPKSGLSAAELLKRALGRTEGRGGGQDNFAMGGFSPKYINEISSIIKQELARP